MSKESKDYRRRNRLSEQFAPRAIRMLESPAYRALSLPAHRVLARIEIELAHHGGHDNGKLPVTFDHFVEYGVRRHSVASAIRELEALGFIEVTEQGRAGNAEWRRPNKFRLTHSYVERASPTDEWALIKTDEEAEMIAKAARRKHTNSRLRPADKSYFPVTVSDDFQCQKRHQKPDFHSADTVTTSHSAESVTTSKLSGPCLSKLEYEARGGAGYLLSSDPRAFDQFGTVRYVGRPYLIVNNDISGQISRKKTGRQPTVSLKVLEVMPAGEALSISEICKRAGVLGLGPVIQAMRKAGKLVRVGRGQYSKAA